MRLDGDITTERFLRYIRSEPMTEESAKRRSGGCAYTETTITWSDLCETGTNRSIDVSALRTWLTSYVRLSSRRSHRSCRRRERGKKHRQVLSIRTPRKFAGVDDSRQDSRWKDIVWPLTTNVCGIVHTVCSKNRYRWHKRRRRPRNSELNKGRTSKAHACAEFASRSLWNARAVPSYQDRPLLISVLCNPENGTL